MDKIIVQGGNTRLSGEVVIEGAKNAVLLCWRRLSWPQKVKQP